MLRWYPSLSVPHPVRVPGRHSSLLLFFLISILGALLLLPLLIWSPLSADKFFSPARLLLSDIHSGSEILLFLEGGNIKGQTESLERTISFIWCLSLSLLLYLLVPWRTTNNRRVSFGVHEIKKEQQQAKWNNSFLSASNRSREVKISTPRWLFVMRCDAKYLMKTEDLVF